MALLHIYDSSDSRICQTANERGVANRVGISDAGALQGALRGLLATGIRYDRVLFETHGSPGRIYFNDGFVGTNYWRNARGVYNGLTAPGCRIYFNGCNVAETEEGWKFLEAAAGAFIATGGGQVFGQTSVGFGNPFNGHVVHLWGSTRTVFVDANGRITERFEQ